MPSNGNRRGTAALMADASDEEIIAWALKRAYNYVDNHLVGKTKFPETEEAYIKLKGRLLKLAQHRKVDTLPTTGHHNDRSPP